jgi:hypothetical protein
MPHSLQRKLSEVDEKAWASLPDSLDFTRANTIKNKKLKFGGETFSALPDAMIAPGAGLKSSTTLETAAEQGSSGTETPLGLSTPIGVPADLTQLGR